MAPSLVHYVWVVQSQNRELGSLVRGAREALGLTQEEAAAQIATRQEITYTGNSLSKLENGAVGVPRWKVLRGLNQVLEIPMVRLLVAAGILTRTEADPLIRVAEIRQTQEQLARATQRLAALEQSDAEPGATGGRSGNREHP